MYRRLLIVVLACGEIAVVLRLLRYVAELWHEAAGTGLRAWLLATPLDEAVVALTGAAAIVCAGWLVLSFLLATIAYVTRIPAMVRSVEWSIPAAIRRPAERIAFSVLVASALAATPVGAENPPVLVDADGFGLPPALAGSAQILGGLPDRTTNRLMTVLAGDNLWSISARHLTGLMDRRPDAGEIAAYWRRVIEHNRGRLSSGDPDLIYPGEVVEMPPTGDGVIPGASSG